MIASAQAETSQGRGGTEVGGGGVGWRGGHLTNTLSKTQEN